MTTATAIVMTAATAAVMTTATVRRAATLHR